MKIYLFDNMTGVSDEVFWRIVKIIPAERVAKAMKFRNMLDRKLSVIAYLLLVYGLKKEYGICEELIFSLGEHGKPHLRDHPEIFFNISHCHCGVVCVIASNPVGIDMEEVGRYDDDVAKYICNEEEYDELCRSRQPAMDFCKLWTAKESVLKFTGEGICTDLKSVLHHVPFKIETICEKNHQYVISVCDGYQKSSQEEKI